VQVREDILEHRSAARSANDTLLRERNAIHSSDRAINDVLGQAEAARSNLNAQRAIFNSVGTRLGLLSDVAPKINSLIGTIGRRKSRDKMILGVVVGCCMSLLLLYSMS
jgi:Golgi SNAP receptor complex protein 1